jgi:hypothetical protein
MPAAELSKMQAQISAISTQFNQPRTFVNNLLILMEQYQDRISQIGDVAKINVIMRAYHIPSVMLNQLEFDLAKKASKYSEDALEIADLLWEDKHYEARLMAIVLLGNIHQDSSRATTERLLKWINPNLDNNLLAALFSIGTQQLRSGNMDIWRGLIQQWLRNENEEFYKIGLQALKALIDDPYFEDFPFIFKSLEGMILHLSIPNQNQLLKILETLVHRLPLETVAFLHSMLNMSNTRIMKQFIRRCLPLFDKTVQNDLKVSLK